MLIQNKVFKDENDKIEFINECENAFKNQFVHLSDKIISKPDVKVITLSGPTCSGKTVTAFNLTNDLVTEGIRVYKISIDDFYRNRDDIAKEALLLNKLPDYDTIRSIDFETFRNCVYEIYDNKEVHIPVFNFMKGKRDGYVTFNPKEHDIIIFEGIQAIYPQITDILDDYPYISISINVRDDISVNNMIFNKREIRLMRRLVRDIRARNASPDITFNMWHTTVTPNEDENILPYEDNTDIRLNSLMPYEINVIKPFLLKTLDSLSPKSEYTAIARDYRERLKDIEEINAAYIPETSLYKEFIG